MPYCGSCGKASEDGQKFCRYCGRPVAQAGAAAPLSAAPPALAAPPAPAPPLGPGLGAVYPPPSAYPPGAWSAPQPRRSRKGLLIGLAALVVVVAVACVLAFVVFKGGGGAASAPEQTVKRLFTAMENKDLDAVLDLMDPQLKASMPTGDALQAAKEEMRQTMFDYKSIKFSGIKMSTEMASETTATVTITAGSATRTDSDGQTTTEDVKDADTPATVDLTKQDGSWYLESSSLF
jgi:ketosteroid isomerase-like protein